MEIDTIICTFKASQKMYQGSGTYIAANISVTPDAKSV